MAESEATEETWQPYGGWEDDDTGMDNYALFVLDDVPASMVNEVLRRNHEENHDWFLWVVDDYNNYPDFKGTAIEGTHDDVGEEWRSPFIGSSLHDAAAYLRSIPKPSKALCKTYFVALVRERYEEYDQLLICNIVGEEVQPIPCTAEWVGTWLGGHDRDVWEERYKAWCDSEEPIG